MKNKTKTLVTLLKILYVKAYEPKHHFSTNNTHPNKTVAGKTGVRAGQITREAFTYIHEFQVAIVRCHTIRVPNKTPTFLVI